MTKILEEDLEHQIIKYDIIFLIKKIITILKLIF